MTGSQLGQAVRHALEPDHPHRRARRREGGEAVNWWNEGDARRKASALRAMETIGPSQRFSFGPLTAT